MKKTYINPTLKTVVIEARASLLDASRLEVGENMTKGEAAGREASFDFTEE